jgi:hypothetical protein
LIKEVFATSQEMHLGAIFKIIQVVAQLKMEILATIHGLDYI